MMIKASLDVSLLSKALANVQKTFMIHGQSIPEISAKEYAAEVKQSIDSQKFPFAAHKEGRWRKGVGSDEYWRWLGTAYKSIVAHDATVVPSVPTWQVDFSDYVQEMISVEIPVKYKKKRK